MKGKLLKYKLRNDILKDLNVRVATNIVDFRIYNDYGHYICVELKYITSTGVANGYADSIVYSHESELYNLLKRYDEFTK